MIRILSESFDQEREEQKPKQREREREREREKQKRLWIDIHDEKGRTERKVESKDSVKQDE